MKSFFYPFRFYQKITQSLPEKKTKRNCLQFQEIVYRSAVCNSWQRVGEGPRVRGTRQKFQAACEREVVTPSRKSCTPLDSPNRKRNAPTAVPEGELCNLVSRYPLSAGAGRLVRGNPIARTARIAGHNGGGRFRASTRRERETRGACTQPRSSGILSHGTVTGRLPR